MNIPLSLIAAFTLQLFHLLLDGFVGPCDIDSPVEGKLFAFLSYTCLCLVPTKLLDQALVRLFLVSKSALRGLISATCQKKVAKFFIRPSELLKLISG